MGYVVKSLASLSVNEEINLYVFTINDSFTGGDFEYITNNFQSLARSFGESAAIVLGSDKYFSDEVSKQYLGKGIDELWDVLPALLITDALPEQISPESLKLFAPLQHIHQKFQSFDIFFRELINFKETRNHTFLEKFEEKTSWVNDVLHIVDLKPNIFGFGVNINKFLEKFRG